MLRNLLFASVAAAAILALPDVASATVYSGSATFSDVTTGNTLTVGATPNPASFTTGNLALNGTYFESGLMNLAIGGSYASFFGSTQTDQIALAFTFTAPSAATGSPGDSGSLSYTEFLFPVFNTGMLTFTGATNTDAYGTYARQTVNFADGAQIYLDVYNEQLDNSNPVGDIDIRVTNVKDPTATPEPASLALVATSLIGIGLVGRKRVRR